MRPGISTILESQAICLLLCEEAHKSTKVGPRLHEKLVFAGVAVTQTSLQDDEQDQEDPW
jgi:hypothetical protein